MKKIKNTITKDLIIWMLAEFKQIQESYNINEEEIVRLSNLEIQKLLYFINGNYYAKFGKKLISDKFETWKYGPVIPYISMIKRK